MAVRIIEDAGSKPRIRVLDPAQKKPGVLKDLARTIPSAVAQTVNDLAFSRGNAASMRTPGPRLPGAVGAANELFKMATFGPSAGTVNALLKFSPYQPQTVAGEYARTGVQMLPNAMVPGSAAAKTAAVVLPALGSETAGQIARAAGAGKKGEAAARLAGGVAGGAAASVRIRPKARTAMSPVPKQDPQAMRQIAAKYRAAGIEPTAVDLMDESGKGAVRAAATRMTPGRQMAQDFGDRRALDLPDRIGKQARAHMSDDPRTPMQIADELGAARGKTADAQFGAVRGDLLDMAPETVQALRTDYGRAAISEAAKRERDPEVRAALMRLANAALDDPSTQITVGMADRISRVLLGQAKEARDPDLAATLGNLGRSVREPARAASPGYGEALGNYRTQTKLMEAADRGEDFLNKNTDEFVADVSKMTPEERQLALATGRRGIERAVGENTSAAPNVARKIATAPEQRARNNALLGDRAPAFENAMALEARAVENARQVAPRTGSWTSQNDQDAQRMAGIAQVGRRLISGDKIGLAIDWLKSRGMNDNQAEALVRMATDKTLTDQAVAQIAQRYGPEAARQVISIRQVALKAAPYGAGLSAAAATPARAEEQR